MSEKSTEALIIESLITLLSMFPTLLQMFQNRGALTEEDIRYYRERIRVIQETSLRSFDKYLEEARELYGDG